MNLKIYRKICKLVRIEKIKDDEEHVVNYLVQSKRTRKLEWHTILETISEKRQFRKTLSDSCYNQGFRIQNGIFTKKK